MKLYVCVGSSCHLKGSYEVIEKFKEIIKKYDLQDTVELMASFCLGHCEDGVTIKIDDKLVFNVNKENAEEVFLSEIYKNVKDFC